MKKNFTLLLLAVILLYPAVSHARSSAPRSPGFQSTGPQPGTQSTGPQPGTQSSAPADSSVSKVLSFPSRLFSRISGQSASLNQQLTQQTEKYLQKLARREERLKKKISRIDSAGAARLFNPSVQQQYAALAQNIKKDSTAASGPARGQYLANADSVKVSLSFLQQHPELLNGSSSQLTNSLTELQQVQAKMQNAGQTQDFVRQRKAEIQQYLSHFTQLPSGLSKEYQGLNQDMYYYSQQLEQYRQLLNDPDQMEKKALAMLNQLPAFQQFMQNNSQLATLFGVPNNTGAAQSLAGLQTRDQMQQIVQGKLTEGGSGGMSALQQNLQSAKAQLDQLKDRVTKLGAGGGDMDQPNFKPNTEKTKTFLNRIAYGMNLQTTRNNYFPITTDVGLSLGYKLNSSNTIGVGASYKIGWGTDIRHIAVSSQGLGLRSFLDVKLKGSFYASGGYELNYQQPMAGFLPIAYYTHIGNESLGWTKSGLIGLSKVVSLQTKFFKNTKLQVLWDFLSYQQVPKTQPFLFRVGYGF